jgi:hypothetical protein
MESHRALQVQLENEWLSTMNQYKEEAADHQRCMDELRSTHRQSLETIESLQNTIKQLTSHSTVHSVDALHDRETIIDRNIDEDSREVSKLRHDYEISPKRSHQLWSSPRMVFSLSSTFLGMQVVVLDITHFSCHHFNALDLLGD